MATYVIGDLHGSYDAFNRLLDEIHFSPTCDQIYLVGDLINRGENSLALIRQLMADTDSFYPVLGNHDLSFLVYAAGHIPLYHRDTFNELLHHPDSEAILHYLKAQPLMRHLPHHNVVIVHAGIPPQWSIEKALSLSSEVAQILTSSNQAADFIANMFGNTPVRWCDTLTGIERLRTIVNYFTRMRYLTPNGELNFSEKGHPQQVTDKELLPWFELPPTVPRKEQIIFGHWATLGLHSGRNNTLCIDSGCVWGKQLTAAELTPSGTIIHQVEAQI